MKASKLRICVVGETISAGHGGAVPSGLCCSGVPTFGLKYPINAETPASGNIGRNLLPFGVYRIEDDVNDVT